MAAIDRADRSIVNYGDFWQLDTGEMFVVIDFDTLYKTELYIPPDKTATEYCPFHHAVIVHTLGHTLEPYDTSDNIGNKGYAYCTWRTGANSGRVKSRAKMSQCFNEIMRYSENMISGISTDNIISYMTGGADVELLSSEMLGFDSIHPSENQSLLKHPSFLPLMSPNAIYRKMNRNTPILLRNPVSSVKAANYKNGHLYAISVNAAVAYPMPFAYVR